MPSSELSAPVAASCSSSAFLPPRGAVYVSDGSIEGLLCVVAEARGRGELPAGVEGGEGLLALSEVRTVARDDERAERTLREFAARAGTDALYRVMLVLLADQPGLDAALADYLLLGFHLGSGVTGFHSQPAVHTVQRLARKVAGEIHRLKGLVRFRELSSGLFWAPIQPDYDVAWVVGRHFTRRLPHRHWMIHDVGRDTGVIWDGIRMERVDVVSPLLRESAELPAGLLSDREVATQTLWREYFRSISIPARCNPRQQRRCVPRRYWNWLVERPGATAPPSRDAS